MCSDVWHSVANCSYSMGSSSLFPMNSSTMTVCASIKSPVQFTFHIPLSKWCILCFALTEPVKLPSEQCERSRASQLFSPLPFGDELSTQYTLSKVRLHLSRYKKHTCFGIDRRSFFCKNKTWHGELKQLHIMTRESLPLQLDHRSQFLMQPSRNFSCIHMYI